MKKRHHTSSSSAAPSVPHDKEMPLDALVIGAGVSGIGAAYYLKEAKLTFKVLERREDLGGTWSFFQYPGFRNDSDMYSFSFAFHPWSQDKNVVDGASILAYIKDIVATYHLDQYILFNRHCQRAAWSSESQSWTVSTPTSTYTARFLFLCSGYYDYDQPYMPAFPGIERFKGTLVHAQNFTPQVDYTDKRVILIGSGATAITVLPAMAKKARHITLLQRTPTYISPIPSSLQTSGFFHLCRSLAKSIFGRWFVYRLIRWYFILKFWVEYHLCRIFPYLARHHFSDILKQELPSELRPHFNPSYRPWDQRICADPDSEFFATVRNTDKVTIVTDHIKSFSEEGIITQGIGRKEATVDGWHLPAIPAQSQELKADVVVVATGLKLAKFGKMCLVVDGEVLTPDSDLSSRFLYKGCMVSGIPNLWWYMGYTNASWTLKVDLTAKKAVRMIREMERKGQGVVCPRYPEGMRGQDAIDLTSSYIQRDVRTYPKQGDRFPWRMPQNYLRDLLDHYLFFHQGEEGALAYTAKR